MKTLKSYFVYVIACLSLLFLYSCDLNAIEPVGLNDPVGEIQKIRIEGSGYTTKAELKINNNKSVTPEQSMLIANGSSDINKLESCAMELTHIAYRDANNNIILNDSRFIISGTNGNALKGYYKKSGFSRDLSNPLDLVLSINGGTGDLQKASGELRMRLIDNPDIPGQFHVDFSGIILVPVQKPTLD